MNLKGEAYMDTPQRIKSIFWESFSSLRPHTALPRDRRGLGPQA
jgi:hypothetical protein